MTSTDILKTKFQSSKTFTILSTICVNSSFVIATDSGSPSDNPYKPGRFAPCICWTSEITANSAQNKTPREWGVFFEFCVSYSSFDSRTSAISINNPATGPGGRHAIFANVKGVAICAALSPQSGEYVRE